MAIQEFETGQELDDAAERVEELAFQHLHLKEEVEDKRKDLEYAKKELLDFESDYLQAL
jgi:hypothetical protein